MIDEAMELHANMVDAVNSAKTQLEHDIAEAELRGFREGLRAFMSQRAYCAELVRADLRVLDTGTDRPTCCGVFLDWEPEEVLR